MNKELFV